MKSRVRVMFLAAVLVVMPGLAGAQDEALEHLVVEMADTADEHTAIASYYRAKAAEARQEVRRHERMARIYAAGRTAQPQRMRNHCARLAEQFSSVAEEYEQLAQLHTEEATRVGGTPNGTN